MTRRRHYVTSTLTNSQQHEWAFGPDNSPVHISRAVRGEPYTCPVCGGKMVAKLGEIKQHHFAHEQVEICRPVLVAQTAARRWLAQELQNVLSTRRGVIMTWPCPLCRHTHTANLLHDVTTIKESHVFGEAAADLALLDASGELLGAITLARPNQNTLITYASHGVMVIVVDLAMRHANPSSLETFLAGARIYGGICTTQRDAARKGVITGEKQLRQILTDAVSQSPHFIYGLLEDFNGLTHVLTYGDLKLWLPPILWQRAIGGLHHAINPALQIMSQEWQQSDGATIALYYVTAQNMFAIAVRRFAPGQPVHARLQPGVLQTTRLNALAVARNFALM